MLLHTISLPMTNSEFKFKHFVPEISLCCLRWYGSTPMSCVNLSDMLAERGISINRWFIEYSPQLRKIKMELPVPIHQ